MKRDSFQDIIASASRIRQIRLDSGLSQERFSEMLGISVSAYKKIEYGQNQVSLHILRKLWYVFHVSADYLLFGVNEWDVLGGVLWRELQKRD